MKWVIYQFRSMIAELMMGWAMAIDPTTDREVRRAWRDLFRAKVAQIEEEFSE